MLVSSTRFGISFILVSCSSRGRSVVPLSPHPFHQLQYPRGSPHQHHRCWALLQFPFLLLTTLTRCYGENSGQAWTGGRLWWEDALWSSRKLSSGETSGTAGQYHPTQIWRGCERREETLCVMTSDPLENRPISPQRISLDRINIVLVQAIQKREE